MEHKEVGKIELRDLNQPDLEQIIEIAESLPEWFTKTGIKYIKTDIKYQKGFVAVNDDKIVGFLSFFVNEAKAKIGWLGIRREFQRQGIRKKLIDRLVTTLQKDGISQLQVDTLGNSVDYEPYTQTRAFYHKLGFKESGKIKQDNPQWPELLIMVKYI